MQLATFKPAQSELSIIQMTEQTNLQDIKFQNKDIEFLRSSLKSVYPTQFSPQNSLFILLSPKYTRVENKFLSILMVQMKNNANYDITDQEIINSLAYEIQIKIIHRETQQLLNKDNYCLLSFDWFQAVQELELYQLEEDKNIDDLYDYIQKYDWNMVKNKQNNQDEKFDQCIKDFIKDNTKNEIQEGSTRAFAIQFVGQESLNLLGTYDIHLSFRNIPIIQSQITCIPTLNFNLESIAKLNKIKINQQQVLQKFKLKENKVIVYQSNGTFVIDINKMSQLKQFTYQNQIQRKNSTSQNQLFDEEFSITSNDDETIPSTQAPNKREIQVESDVNEFIRKLFGGSQRDYLTTFELQSAKGSKTIVDSSQDQIQINGKQKITKYNDQNIIQQQIRIFSLEIITGSCIIFFDRDSAIQNSIQTPDNGIHVFKDCITFSSNIQYFQIKFVQSQDCIDVYCNNQFLGNYQYENLYLKFCSKNTEIKLE